MSKRAFAFIFALLFCATLFLPVSAEEAEEYEYLERLVDTENLLADDEYFNLLFKLDDISERHNVDTAIIMTDFLFEGYTSQEMADDIFDYYNFGMGSDRSGILLLIVTEDREWAISTRGYGITAFTDAGQKHIIKKIKSDITNGNYNTAFNNFADLCDDFLVQAKTDKPYDKSNLPSEPLSAAWIPFSFIVGIIVAFFITRGMKSKLVTVRKALHAGVYVKPGTLNVTRQRETFLYHRLTKTEKSSSSSGSSTRRSSSGATHGGSSGKF